MEVKVIDKGQEGEIVLTGRLDSQSAPDVETVAMEAADKYEKIILNLETLEYTSSAGLRIIRNLQVKLNKKGGELLVKGTNNIVMEVFEMTGFATFLKFI